jgi:hypothetical protein
VSMARATGRPWYEVAAMPVDVYREYYRQLQAEAERTRLAIRRRR